MIGAAELIVEKGPDKGRGFFVPVGGGIRVGRSSSNDAKLTDLAVSRFHCRFYFKDEDKLWVADLGSSNDTLVNDKPVTEQQVRKGDRVGIGDTVMLVASDGSGEEEVAVPSPGAAGTAPIDLGLTRSTRAVRARGVNRGLLLLLACGMAAAVLVVWAPKLARIFSGDVGGDVERPSPVSTGDLDLRYEKVIGGGQNIFRYFLLVRNGSASVEVDDVVNGRHFTREPSPVKRQVLERLAQAIERTGFFGLEPEFRGAEPGAYNLCDIAVSIGARTLRVTAFNSEVPRALGETARMIEEFGVNEFGLRALPKPREELVRLAEESFLLGKKLRDEKNVRNENLFLAMRALTEARIYLETVDPKPEFFAEIATLEAECSEELAVAYEDLRFRADRAIKLRDWQGAAQALRVVCAMIPDRDHEWYQQAEQTLVDVERHMER